jgi:hypothetical protein
MKRINTILILLVLIAVCSYGQVKTYVTSGLEIPFSFGDITDNGKSASSTLRFAPIINLETMYNADMSNKFGLFTGLALRNVGYIYDHYTDPDPANNGAVYKKKFRSFNVGVPVGIKLGDLNKTFLYGGYEVELAVQYKEKTFDGGDKINTTTGWFSDRQKLFQHGFIVGIQFPYGANIKFKYYLSEFHNRGFENSNQVKPYAALNTHVFCFSLNMFLFKNLDFYIQQ